jgi:hypothetical protein
MNLQNIANLNIFSVFVFILIVSANFLAELFPCRLQHLLRNNMIMKHLFGVFTMMFFVVFSSNNKEKNLFKLLFNSFLLYVLFILITKCDVYAFYLILIFLGITYIVNILKQNETENIEKEKDNKKKELINNKINMYNNVITIFYFLIIIITIIGVILYIGEKKIEYKKKFNFITFFIGKPACKNSSPSTNIFKGFKYAFK